MKSRLFFFILCFTGLPLIVLAQEDKVVRVDRILILGNRKTQAEIILRELDFAEGQEVNYQWLINNLKQNEDKLMNTSLFITTKVEVIEGNASSVNVVVRVKERWYTWPLPVFSLADRNLNDWVENHGADVSRLNYGIQFRQENIRGRGEELGMVAQLGYTRRFGIYYKIPYLNEKQNLGTKLKFNYRLNQNLPVKTEDHKRVFLDAQTPIQEWYEVDWMFTVRNGFYVRHEMGVNYNHRWAADTILQENPHYFANDRKDQRVFGLYYTLRVDHRDFQNYATEGDFFYFNVQKNGLGIFGDVDQWEFLGRYSKYWKLPKQFYISTLAAASLSFPAENQPYTHLNGLGFRPYDIRGYELNVIEGQHYFLNKWDFKKRLLAGTYDFYPITQMSQFNGLPYAFYLKFFGDYGYVKNYPQYQQNSRLTDEIIYSFGLGLDMVAAYDFVFRLEVSYNSMQQTNFGFAFLSAI
ncbi:BamA/TamA family outer membrane protein [Persicobacter sp. CCB-QB2]|uniref:BamA/TamA family outer membrane protein n=1 Tax=Persicobacter sp. CCB-QB2 TaxID=1561025 RepID=UPI0006A990D1|nr:BamA/TamA family outer membrane protein [Persicobacter sp. CCB-QB2]